MAKMMNKELEVRTWFMTTPERPIQLKVRTQFTTSPKRCIKS